MDNQTEGNYYQPYRPEDPAPAPPPRYYDGNQNFATLSLVMGILALVSLCCFPFISIPFAGLGILFSCLSKGRFSRPGPAKAGLAISSTLLAILIAVILVFSAIMIASPTGRNFLQDYMDLITSDRLTEQDLYNFIEKYTREFSGSDSDLYSQPEDPYYDNGRDAYEDFFDDYYDYFNGGGAYPDDPYSGGGAYPGYEQPSSGSGDNYI
ncbi:MAG TPA: DUF4190 domain-containing protein [Candidatus Blautia avicola]|uniref:DUF4190 domain-containing protein n=1 Tax=Candidatus Blautia avicola TaxID=2838483 RepID=A0A9D2QXH8_9FIRM|nr:DUF4190 domain-containing protein [Candidatus Blautia avicola]